MITTSLAPVSVIWGRSWRIPSAPSISSYGGIIDRLCLQMWGGKGSHFSIVNSLQIRISPPKIWVQRELNSSLQSPSRIQQWQMKCGRRLFLVSSIRILLCKISHGTMSLRFCCDSFVDLHHKLFCPRVRSCLDYRNITRAFFSQRVVWRRTPSNLLQ